MAKMLAGWNQEEVSACFKLILQCSLQLDMIVSFNLSCPKATQRVIEIFNENSTVTNGKLIISNTTSASLNPKVLMMKEDIKMALESLGYVNSDVSKWIKDEELMEISNTAEALKVVLRQIQNKK